jgi:hypothetical protein
MAAITDSSQSHDLAVEIYGCAVLGINVQRFFDGNAHPPRPAPPGWQISTSGAAAAQDIDG